MRLRRAPLLLQDFEYASDGFADFMPELIDGFALGIAAREGWDLSPETAIRVFVEDNGVILHVSILSQAAMRGHS